MLELVADRRATQDLVSAALVLWQVRDRVAINPVSDLAVPDGLDLRPARRLGTYKGAPNRIAMYASEREGHPLLLATESLLELAWLRQLDFHPGTTWIHTQPFVLCWPVAGRCIWRIPDILARVDSDQWLLADVKPDERLAASTYTRRMFELTAMTMETIGVHFRHLGSMGPTKLRNLRALARCRHENPHLADGINRAREAQARSLGGVRDSAGQFGREVAMHLLTKELTADLSTLLTLGSPVSWRPEPLLSELQRGPTPAPRGSVERWRARRGRVRS